MPKVDIWMPIYIGDYIKDTQELTGEEHGCYLLLIMHYWLKDGDFGTNIKRLSTVAKSSEETTKYILDNYFTFNGDKYCCKRADEEMEAAQSRSESARKNANKRWDKQKECDSICDGIADGHADDMRNGCSSSSSSSSSSSLPSKSKTDKGKPRPVFLPPEVSEVKEYCKERKNTVDAEHWHDFYTAKDWMIGKNKMKDWKAAVRTWETKKETTADAVPYEPPPRYNFKED